MSHLRDELQSIYEKRGELTARSVLDTARNPNSVLHHRFEWDDAIAGEKYRLSQAAELIRSVKIVYSAGGESRSLRAFVSVRESDTENRRAYVPTEKVLEDPFLRKMLLAECQREINALKTKYGHLQEFAEMIQKAIA